MDKSLKKLSRLELLELMVRLSEDRDALIDENERLRYALAAKPVIPRAAKVGSIAELALQTNGFFEAAQRSADDYLREIKRMRDQLASRAAAEGIDLAAVKQPASQAAASESQASRAQVQQACDAALKDAQNEARKIVRRANAQADAIVANARSKSEEVLADAKEQSRAIIAQANRQADAVISAARSDAARSRAAKPASASVSAKPSSAKAASVTLSPALSAPIRGRHVRAVAE